MNLGVYLTRRSHLKVLSPVMDAALARRHSLILVADPKPAKAGDALRVDELESLWPEAKIEEYPPFWLDSLIGLSTALPRGGRIPKIGVDHFYDAWLYPPRLDLTMCYHSDYHRTQHAEMYEAPLSGHVTGWLPGDQAYRLLPQTRDSVVFFTLKMDVDEPWRRTRAGRAFYKDAYYDARQHARAEGLRFVVKSRGKNGDPWWVRWGADAYVLDTTMVPYTSLRLLGRAKWCVHFESGAVLEAAVMGAYSIAHTIPQTVASLPGGSLQYGRVPMHQWPGVAQYGMPGVIPTVTEAARRSYVEHFVGPVDGRAGERVIQVAECQS